MESKQLEIYRTSIDERSDLVFLLQRNGTLYITYEEAWILDEPPYYDLNLPLRYDWSNTHYSYEEGIVIDIRDFFATAKILSDMIARLENPLVKEIIEKEIGNAGIPKRRQNRL